MSGFFSDGALHLSVLYKGRSKSIASQYVIVKNFSKTIYQ